MSAFKTTRRYALAAFCIVIALVVITVVLFRLEPKILALYMH